MRTRCVPTLYIHESRKHRWLDDSLKRVSISISPTRYLIMDEIVSRRDEMYPMMDVMDHQERSFLRFATRKVGNSVTRIPQKTTSHESPGILHKVRERGVEESFKVGFSRLSQVPTSDT